MEEEQGEDFVCIYSVVSLCCVLCCSRYISMVNIVSTLRRRRNSQMRLCGLVPALAVAAASQHIVVRTEVALAAVTSRAMHTPTAMARPEDLVVSVN